MKNYIFDKEKEINLENYYIKPNGNEEVKQNNKEELDIKNSYKILEEKNKNLEDNIKIQEKSKNLEETPKPKEEKRKILIIPKNLNKISEEINFQIFNEKPSNQKKSSYIDIDFHYKDNNKKKNRNNSEKMKNHIVLEFKPILIENNISKKSNKSKINFNKSHINIKDFNNNNNFVNRYSAFPISKHFFIQSNRKNMVIKINNDNIKEKKEIIPQTLDSLMNKIKINNLKRSQNSNNNRINKKIKDIKDSLKKMSDIKQQKKINTNQNSLNNIYLDYIEDSFLPKKKFSRNLIPSKRTDSSDFIFYNNFNNNYYNNSKFHNNYNNREYHKKENNFSLPSKRITKKINSNSYSNIHTSNCSPIHFAIKNKDIFKINNNNIDNLQIINKKRKISDFLEDFETKDLLKLISISDRSNSQSIIDDDIKNKNNNTINNKNSKENNIRLYYTSEKNGNVNRNEPKTNLLRVNYSNFNSYINKIKEKNLMKDYAESKSKSKVEEKEPSNAILNRKKINFILNKQKYIYNNENIVDKNSINKKNKIKNNHNYSQQTKTKTIDNFYVYNQNYKSKNILFSFEKIKRKKIHSIFPVNPFDSINYIKVNNFLNN